jgi:hypothetical protein
MKATTQRAPYGQTTTAFSVDDLGALQLLSSEVLAAVASGRLDLNLAARHELASRGQDKKGAWVGFDKAARIHGV